MPENIVKINYVYVYRVGGTPVYVGIGQDTGGKFNRARDISGHARVSAAGFAAIEINIVAQHLGRKEARRLEAILITQYESPDLLNKQRPVDTGDTFLHQVILTADGTTRKRSEGSQAAFHRKWQQLIPQLESQGISSGEAQHFGYLEAHLLTGYRPPTFCEEELADYLEGNDSASYAQESPYPVDDSDACLAKRVITFLNYFSDRRPYHVERICDFACTFNIKIFCMYLDSYFSYYQLPEDCDSDEVANHLRLWFQGQVRKLPKLSWKSHSLARSVFQQLYHVINAEAYPICGKYDVHEANSPSLNIYGITDDAELPEARLRFSGFRLAPKPISCHQG